MTILESSLETSPVADRCNGGLKSVASTLHVFVRLPHQRNRTVPLTLTAPCGVATVEALCAEVQKIAQIPQQLVQVTLRGHPLKSVSQLRPNDTLVAVMGAGLLGGAYAILKSEGLADIPIENKDATFGEIKTAFESAYPSTKKAPFRFKYFFGGDTEDGIEAPDDEDDPAYIALMLKSLDDDLGH